MSNRHGMASSSPSSGAMAFAHSSEGDRPFALEYRSNRLLIIAKTRRGQQSVRLDEDSGRGLIDAGPQEGSASAVVAQTSPHTCRGMG